MGLREFMINLFRPGWKHPDPQERIRSVSRMSSNIVLMDVYEHDEDATVRAAVVSRLKDQELLTNIAENDKDYIVRKAAYLSMSKNDLIKLTNQAYIADVAKNDKDCAVRYAAVRKLTDQTVLVDIAKNDKERRVRYDAVRKLTDQTVLVDIAKNDEDSSMREAAFAVLGWDLAPVEDALYASLTGLASGSDTAQELQKQCVLNTGLPLEAETKQAGIKLRLVPPGTFMMGSPVGENGRDDDETLHQVTLTQPFYCGKFAVTQRQWKRVMGNNPSKFTRVGEDAPVEQVSWKDCKDFLQKLCKLEGVPQGTYRLLTEAEWEYACRAGTSTAFCYGDSLNSSQANFNGYLPYNASKGIWREKTTAAGSFKPNAFGLYDMHGNVREWCNDWYGSLSSSIETDPVGTSSGLHRANRGGYWRSRARFCRSADRFWDWPSYRDYSLGIRLARITPVNK